MRTKKIIRFVPLMCFLLLSLYCCKGNNQTEAYRVIVSTDIGGTDYDDYQSMVHLFLYADTLDIEGIIASPFGDGRKEHILEAIDAYEIDYPNLVAFSTKYPAPDSLRKITKQGALYDPGPVGYASATEGSEWIVACARKNDPRPLHVLIWGGIEDLAQALHDAPDILPRLRVHFIGGPNKKWSVNAYQYIAENFPGLWMIESNATYRGWFVGGNQTGKWGNDEFVETCIKNFGAMGRYFYEKGKRMKMGDSPTLTYVLNGNPEDPSGPSWGGQFVRAWDRPHKVFDRTTNENDSIEHFGVLELRLPFNDDHVTEPYAILEIDRPITGQILKDTVRFLFSPKDATSYPYTISSNIGSLNQQKGVIRAYPIDPSQKDASSSKYPNWWTDDPSPELMERGHVGVKTVNQFREEFLADFEMRVKRVRNKE
jgi:hypothetical protein